MELLLTILFCSGLFTILAYKLFQFDKTVTLFIHNQELLQTELNNQIQQQLIKVSTTEHEFRDKILTIDALVESQKKLIERSLQIETVLKLSRQNTNVRDFFAGN